MSSSDVSQNPYFHRIGDPEIQRRLGEALGNPPACFTWMNAEVTGYVPEEEIWVSIPVLEEYLNPARSMQGGVISAAFDNAFGPLCAVASHTPQSAMVDMTTSFHRPIFEGDVLNIHARVKASGKRKVHMVADAYNNENKLIASSSATYMILG